MRFTCVCEFLGLVSVMGALGMAPTPGFAATVWHVSAGGNAADTNPGSADQPVRTVTKAVSLAKPGDTLIFSPGTYRCPDVRVPEATSDRPITLRSDGKGRVIFSSDRTSL